jgi:hypothetical protein
LAELGGVKVRQPNPKLLWLDEDFEPICSRLSRHLKTIGN